MRLIKICGIMQPEMALFASQAGADFIGIMLHSKSKRYVSPNIAREIVLAAKEGGSEPVAVFVDENEDAISEICEKIAVERIQVYKKQKIKHPFKMIYANEFPERIREEDFLLYDGANPGSGHAFNWDAFSPPAKDKWFLAGGLNSKNVKEAISKLNPNGVDISSGVELNGRKDKGLIEEFIHIVRSCELIKN